MAEKKPNEKKAEKPEESKGKKENPAMDASEPDKKIPSAGKQSAEKEPTASVKESMPDSEKSKDESEESYLKDLMSISGQGGLFRFVSQGRNGVIVENIETGKRMQAFATMKVSSLEDIAVYTQDEEIQLLEVLAAIHSYEKGTETISPKSDPDELKDYFGSVLPEYDRERVYVSDIKKILGWYNLLLKHKLIEVKNPLKKTPRKEAEAGDQ